MDAVWPHEGCLVKEFHDHLNNQQPSIQFMMEEQGCILGCPSGEESRQHPHICVQEEDKHRPLSQLIESHHHPRVNRVNRGIIKYLKSRAEKV